MATVKTSSPLTLDIACEVPFLRNIFFLLDSVPCEISSYALRYSRNHRTNIMGAS